MTGKIRFAPSPTGYLHEGHLLSALYVWAAAKAWNLKIHLRIEDHDQSRARPAYIDGIREDLAWLGFEYDSESIQSARTELYRESLENLKFHGLVYPCFCSRKQLQAENPKSETGEIIYQGKCKGLVDSKQWLVDSGNNGASREVDLDERFSSAGMPDVEASSSTSAHLPSSEHFQLQTSILHPSSFTLHSPAHLPQQTLQPAAYNLRVIMPDEVIRWHDLRLGDFAENPHLQCGDFPIRDRDGQWTYQFAVCVDDIDEGITHIIRGEDIRNSTARQIALRSLLGAKTPPIYMHHPLIVDSNGKKLSKRELSHSLRQDKEEGLTPEMLFGKVCAKMGFIQKYAPISLKTAISIIQAQLPKQDS